MTRRGRTGVPGPPGRAVGRTLLSGLVAGAELAYFDNDIPSKAQTAGGDKGWSWLADLRLAF